MTTPIVVTNVSKTFRRYDPGRPHGVHEALARGFGRLRSIERFWGLRDVSFQVGAGRTVGIIGANGSGKSTLLRVVGGVSQPDTGTVEVHGRIGALLDLGSGFHGDLTGRENVLVGGVLNGLTRRQVLERFDSILAFAEMGAFIDNPLRTYSSGMRMRLAFATAVHTDPEILLIDEVLSVGDVAFQRKCLARIDEFKAAGCSILLISHETSVIQELCDEVLWLSAGQVQAHGAVREVVRQYISHMSTSSGPADTETRRAPPSLPRGASPLSIVRTERGAEVVVDESRFGSVELEITGVRALTADGSPLRDLPSGRPLQIEIEYAAARRLVAPLFRVCIYRADGLLCYDVNSETSALSLSTIDGRGLAALRLDRLDLNTGFYLVDVGCYAQDWAYAYDYRPSVCSFAVLGDRDQGAVLATLHSWAITEGDVTPAAGSAP